MTKQELFEKYGVDDSHRIWETNDNFTSVSIFRIMNNGALPKDNDNSVQWIIDFLEKSNDIQWFSENIMKLPQWGSIYLTSKRLLYKFSDQILETLNK